MRTLKKFDNTFYTKEIKIIAGIDEAGRGPVAGPVVVAGVIFKKSDFIEGVMDSKKLKEKKLEELFYKIRKKALAYSISIISHNTIDEINILQATFKGMREVADKFSVKPDLILIDGRDEPLDNEKYSQKSIIKGDAKSFSIAAASIIAKVTRDKIMRYYDKQFPEYEFAKHKGYGTKKHREMIDKYGRCKIHRQSFRFKDEDSKQLKLFN